MCQVNILQLATKMEPYDGAMYNSLGVSQRANNSHALALESFTLALSLNHTMDECLLNIGSTWMDMGHFDRALGFFMRALQNNEKNYAALFNIVYCNQKLYNWQDYDQFHMMLEQAYTLRQQILHPFHAASYPLSALRFKQIATRYASRTLALVNPKFRFNPSKDLNESGGACRVPCACVMRAMCVCDACRATSRITPTHPAGTLVRNGKP